MAQQEKLLKAKEIKEQMDCSLAQVYLWMAEGKLKSVRIGRLVRVKPEDFEDFVNQHRN
jgi:excisionase family DNA binding protein